MCSIKVVLNIFCVLLVPHKPFVTTVFFKRPELFFSYKYKILDHLFSDSSEHSYGHSYVGTSQTKGLNSFMYISSYIRTPNFSTHSGYSYGPFQYKNQCHYPYDAKPYVKFAISPTRKPHLPSNKIQNHPTYITNAVKPPTSPFGTRKYGYKQLRTATMIKNVAKPINLLPAPKKIEVKPPVVQKPVFTHMIRTEIFKPAETPVVQEPVRAPIPTAAQTSLRRPVIQAPVQTSVVQSPVHRLGVQTPVQTPVRSPVVQQSMQTSVVQTPRRTPETQEPIELPTALPLLNLRQRVTTPRTTTTLRPTTQFRLPITIPTKTITRTTTTTTTRPTTQFILPITRPTTTTRRTTTEFTFPRTTTMTKTITTTTTSTTMTTTTSQEEEADKNLDFSSGKAEEVQNSASNQAPAAPSTGATNAFSKFRELIDAVGVNDLVEATGNVTIFSPLNKAFDELPTKVEDVPISTVRRWILKHFVKGFLFRSDMMIGPLETLGGEFVTVAKDQETNKVGIFSLSGQSNVKVSNIKTKFGLVHVIDTVLT